MLFVIAYDIADPRRLRKIAKCCELYGGRVEKSVFELELEVSVLQHFLEEVGNLMNLELDSLIVYNVCAACEKNIKILGKTIRPRKENCIFVG